MRLFHPRSLDSNCISNRTIRKQSLDCILITDSLKCYSQVRKRNGEPLSLGEGGHGTVGSFHRFGNGTFAIKKLKTGTARELRSLANEVQILQNCSHSNIVKLFEFSISPSNTASIVLEQCNGGDLFSRLEQVSTFSESQAAHIVKQMLSVVCYLHNKGIVHRDLKLENWMLRSESGLELVLIDFGLSGECSYDEKRLSGEVGTSYYMAPEVGEGYYGQSVDMWSVGILAYMLLSGKCPFHGETESDIRKSARKDRIPFPDKIWGTLPVSSKRFIGTLLSKDPLFRYTAKQAFQDPWIVGQQDETPPTATSEEDLISAMIKGIRAFLELPEDERKTLRMGAHETSFDDCDDAYLLYKLQQRHSVFGRVLKNTDDQVRYRLEKDIRALYKMSIIEENGAIEWNDMVAILSASSPTHCRGVIQDGALTCLERFSRSTDVSSLRKSDVETVHSLMNALTSTGYDIKQNSFMIKHCSNVLQQLPPQIQVA